MAKATMTISTTKGGCTGTLEQIIEWQTEQQGAMERIEACGLTVDVRHVEWGAGDEDEAVLRAICDEILMLRVRTADHVQGADADEGRVIDILDPRTGTVVVAWDQGIRSRCDVLDLIAD